MLPGISRSSSSKLASSGFVIHQQRVNPSPHWHSREYSFPEKFGLLSSHFVAHLIFIAQNVHNDIRGTRTSRKVNINGLFPKFEKERKHTDRTRRHCEGLRLQVATDADTSAKRPQQREGYAHPGCSPLPTRI